MKKHSKKIIAAVIAASLAILCVPGVFALFSSGEGTTNKFKTATADAKIVEKFDPPKELKEGDNVYRKDVKVQNTGNIPVYVRLGINFSDKTAEDATELYNEPIAGLLTKDAEPIKSAQDTDEEAWVFVPSSEDDTLGGYWYYTTPIDPGKSTKSLFNTVKTTFTASDLEEYDINVTMDCVQASDITPNEYTASGTKSVHNVNYKTPDDDYVADGKSDGWRHQWREYLLYTAGSTDHLGAGQKLPTKKMYAEADGGQFHVPNDAISFSRGTKEEYDAAKSAGLTIKQIQNFKSTVPVYTWTDADHNYHWYTTAKKLFLTGQFYFNFSGKSLQAVNLTGLDTSQVTSMYCLFNSCSSLTSIVGLENLNTSNVTDMSDMFYQCRNLTSLDVSNFDTSKVTDMSSMFLCGGYDSSFNFVSHLTEIKGLDHFDTSEVTNMDSMFSGDSCLNTIDVSNFNTSNVTNMDSMFYQCQSLTSLDVSNFDTSKVTNMSRMFAYVSGLKTLDLSHFDTSNVTDMSGMFRANSALTTLDLSGFDTSKVTDMSSMFDGGCTNLQAIYVSNKWTTDAVTKSDGMFGSYAFYNCTKLPHFDSSKVDKTNANTSATGYLTLKQ